VGVSGQDGAYLCRLLVEKGYEVHGATRRRGALPNARLAALGVDADVRFHDIDLQDIASIRHLIDRAAPDEIYNLAAQSFVSASFEHPIATADINATAALRLLECLRHTGAPARFYQASTSEMFGNAPVSPQDEETPFRPRSPYGFAKLFAHWATVNYCEAFGLHASSGVLFNHESPLRGPEFVTRKITLGFARLAAGRGPPVALGNLDACRDWGFAGDYVEGMWRMLQEEQPDDYVLATGVPTSVRDFASYAARPFGWNISWRGEGPDEEGFDAVTGRLLARVSRDFWRPTEVNPLLGNAAKAGARLGWRPGVDVRDLAEMMAEADMRRVRDGAGR